MKILAVRGKNLASLAGSFEVDLTAAPLGEAGLIVVTGPTGAGKSTLLDAMCLALFDQTPRLRGRGAPVGFVEAADRETLSSGDPRCLVRRGAAEARAEVDFVGRDGRRWRATWSVRRARGRADGRMQPQALSLVCLDTDERRGGTRTETLQAIEEALGLDYTAFCRSALLAQGDFASFLQARATERAALLERLTGTELYGALSIAAHRRAADEARDLQGLEARLGAQRPLEPMARAELLREGALRAEAVAASRRARDGAAEAGRWHEERARRVERARRAAAERDAAEAAWRAADDARQELARVDAAQGLRGVVDAFDAATREVAASALAHRDAWREARGAARAEADARAAEAAAGRALDEAEARLRAAAPALRDARALDQQLAAAARELEEASAAATTAHTEAAARAHDAGTAVAALSALEARRVEAEAWLATHARVAPLAAQWPRWEGHLAQHAAARAELARLGAARGELAGAAERAARAREAARAAADATARELARARAAEEALRAAAPDAAAREGLQRRQADLLALEGLDARARDVRGARAREERRAAAASARAHDAQARARAATARADALPPVVAEAERALETLRAARDLAGRRRDLVPGEPCPLCGAREHPAAHDAPPLDRALDEQAARVVALRADLDVARREAEAAGAEARGAEAEAGAAGAARDDLDRTLSPMVDAGRALVAALEQGGLVLGRDAAGEGDLAARAAAAREEAARALEALRALDASLEAARRATQHAERAAEAAREASSSGEDAAREAARRLDACDEARGRAEARAREALAALAPALDPPASDAPAGDDDDAFPLFRQAARAAAPASDEAPCGDGWRDDAARDPAGFLAARRQEARAWRDMAAAAERARVDEVEARTTAEGARLRAEQAASGAARSEADHARRDATWRATRAARERLLGGRPADEVERGLTAARSEALSSHEAARARAAEHAATAAGALARLDEAAARRERAVGAEAEAVRSLRERLAQVGCDLDAARARLARDDAWRATTREALAALERRRSAAAREAEVLEAERAAHDAARPAFDPALVSLSDARSALETATRALALAEARALEVEARREADDAARRQVERLRPQVEAQAARARTWQTLGAVVGSHDGKKLRVFAQSLTLEVLLERANAHLADLSPRYRLERVEGEDLELQVRDRDLGGEVRATTGLSGGESFLVSLALALALSSLCAAGTRVESLFIDEGFGALDPEAQEQALAALDALQATGRQVVLVTHLPAIAERVGLGVRVVPQGQGRSLVEVGA